MQVGDLVKINIVGDLDYGRLGLISNGIPSAGIDAWDVQLDDGKIRDFYEYQLSLIPTKTFSLLDLVTVVNPAYMGFQTDARIVAIRQGNPIFYTIDFVNGLFGPVYGYKAEDIELTRPVGVSGQSTNNYTASSNSGIYRRAGTSLDIGFNTQPANSTHTHNWRFYQGLNSRFEFCTVCDQKRDTDKRI